MAPYLSAYGGHPPVYAQVDRPYNLCVDQIEFGIPFSMRASPIVKGFPCGFLLIVATVGIHSWRSESAL